MKIILLFGIFSVLAILFSGCTEQEEQQSKAIGEIINEYTTANNDISNFVIFVNLTVKNIGDDGDLKVWAYVRQGLTMDDKSKTLFFESGETKSISFAFSEGFELGSSWFYDYGVS